jgi:hypothetical protein
VDVARANEVAERLTALSASVCFVPLSSGSYAIVDAADYPYVSQFSWYEHHTGYVLRTVRVGGKKTTITLGVDLLKPPDGFEVDHKDNNKLNNTRSNLRLATRAQNMMNIGKRRGTYSSRFKGVSLMRENNNRWRAYIQQNKKKLYLGIFATEEEAARAYNEAAMREYGEFAQCNQI